jgi:exopolysaccharide biosynthesis predicted pyruvyltransferase EpsI
MINDAVLKAIPSTEPATFREFLQALGGNFDGEWRQLFEDIEQLEYMGLVEVERLHGRIESMILTPEGAEEVRNA